jgi:E3 ubiquitin-protein ligase MUL1
MLQNAPVLELNDDLKEMVNTHQDKKLPYVVIRGEVEALGSPVTSINDKSITGAIQKLSMKEHVVARGSSGFWCVEYVLLFILMPFLCDVSN